MNNRSFVRALLALAHPLTICAVLLWLLNDHVLKQAWPSWWTGKLSDVAGLVVAPLLLAVPLSWLLPWRMKGHERTVGWLAVGGVGAWWALVVTLLDVHQLSLRVLSFLSGTEFYFERDPSDVIVLPALALAWYVWRRPMPQTSALMARGLLVGVVGMLASLATSYISVPLVYGVNCVYGQSGALYATGDIGLLRSDDSGQTWKQLTDSEARAARLGQRKDVCGVRNPKEFSSPDNPAVRYRISDGDVIERSVDGGRTWRLEFDLSKVNKEVRRWVRQRQVNAASVVIPVVDSGPLGAIVQQGTGVVVLAMGHDGVLVRNASGEWQWVTVGPYQYKEADPISVINFLTLQIVLSVVLIPLIGASIVGLTGGSWRSNGVATFMAIAWIAWSLAAVSALRLTQRFIEPPGDQAFLLFPVWVSYVSLTLFAFMVGLVRVRQETRAMESRFDKAGSAVALWTGSGFILFLLPYMLWAGLAIGSGSVVMVFSFALTGANILVGALHLKKRLRPDFAGNVACPRCQNSKSWRLRAGKRRCARCDYEWTPGRLP